jgi:hypothetical protein
VPGGARCSSVTGRQSVQPLAQLRPAATPGDAVDPKGDGFLLAHQNDKPLTAGNPGVEQIALATWCSAAS